MPAQNGLLRLNAREPVLAYLETGEVDKFLLSDALELLGHDGTTQDAKIVASHANHPYEYVRAAVAEALGQLAAENYSHVLNKQRDDPAEPVRRAAECALLRLAPAEQQVEGLMALLERIKTPREQFKILDQLMELGRDEEVRSFLLSVYASLQKFPQREAWTRLLKMGVYVPTPGFELDEQPWKDLAKKAEIVKIDLKEE